MCLHFLDLLQYEHFRKEIVNGQCARFIDDQQILHWQHYTRKRVRLLQSQAEKHMMTVQNEPTPQKSVWFLMIIKEFLKTISYIGQVYARQYIDNLFVNCCILYWVLILAKQQKILTTCIFSKTCENV